MKHNKMVTSDHFGGNFLFDRYDLSDDFASKLKELGISHLRYPGGAVTEKHFDLRKPNATISPHGSEIIPLKEFLEFIARHELTASIVIPTDFMPDRHGDWFYVAEFENYLDSVADFTRYLIETPNLSKLIETIEIGNEYYDVTLSALDYGRIAGAVSDTIINEYQEFQSLHPSESKYIPEIAVQAGRKGWENNVISREFFSVSNFDKVDELILHDYPWNISDIDSRNDRFDVISTWETAGAVDELELNVSEWNIGSPRGVDGLQHASALLHQFVKMIERGVTKASVWPILQNTQNDLSGNHPTAPLTAAGATFKLISGSLEGATLVSIDYLETDLIQYRFSKGEQEILFISSQSDSSVNLHLPDFLNKNSNSILYISSIAGRPDDDLRDLNSPKFQPDITEFSTSDLKNIYITPFSIHRLQNFPIQEPLEVNTINHGHRVDPARYVDQITGTDSDDELGTNSGKDLIWGLLGDDILEGGAHADKIWGGEGADFIFGNGGADRLHGNQGDDFIYGGLGKDRIHGGSGSDQLHGGHGNDALYGGRHDDVLKGEEGDDVLIGMEGSDFLYGGSGKDIFVFSGDSGIDSIMDFDIDHDKIALLNISNYRIERDVLFDHIEVHIDGYTFVVSTNIELHADIFEFWI